MKLVYISLLSVALSGFSLADSELESELKPDQEQAAISSELLLKTGQSWEGTPLSYPKGEAEIVSARVKIKQGAETGFHCHPVVTMAYVLQGTVQVETADGQVTSFSAGESLTEVMNTWHNGKALDDDLDIVVFYAGAKGVPVTVKPKPGDLTAQRCHPN